MPIYEYECRDCGHKLEIIQRLSDSLLKTCPTCHKDSLKKLVSAAGFQLKGTGWYETDFKNKGKPATKQADGESGEKSTTSDDKPATKTESATAPATAPASTTSTASTD